MRRTHSKLLLALALTPLLTPIPAHSQPRPPQQAPQQSQDSPRPTQHRLPADSTTHHSVTLEGRSLAFSTTAGSITLQSPDGTPEAQMAYIAYTLDTPKPHRPISFAFNGGPGAASATIHLGLLGPWRMPMDDQGARPSAPAEPIPNTDTWLDFTDLVFLDPIGTGFSRLLVNTEETRKKYWSVTGDVTAMADAIRQYLQSTRRMTAPKYIIGESYGGLRAPRLVRELAADQNVGINALILISPKMDYGGNSNALSVLDFATGLPSIAASERAKHGPVTRADMADVEAYAAGDYLTDLLRGPADPQALARRLDRVSALTGLDRAFLERRQGLHYSQDFYRNRTPAQMASRYDTSFERPDPFPEYITYFPFDSLSDAFAAPFGSAMLDLYGRRFNWLPDGPYEQSNGRALRAWDYGQGPTRPESVSALRTELALDPSFRVLIAHGLFDLATPYFRTQLELNQIPPSVSTNRIDFQVYPGGHMFYSREVNRAPFRAAARALYPQE